MKKQSEILKLNNSLAISPNPGNGPKKKESQFLNISDLT